MATVMVSIRVRLVLVMLILVALLLMLLSKSFWQSAAAMVTMVCCKCILVQLCGYAQPTVSFIIFFSVLSDSCFPLFQQRLHMVYDSNLNWGQILNGSITILIFRLWSSLQLD